MRLSEADVQALQNIIDNAKSLLDHNAAATLSQEQVEGSLYAVSMDVSDLCAEHSVEMSSGGF